ncbi:MAG: YfhO family protein [Bryobacterales bacterium]|nr:YfhO family protein [Bryobacterales bacterium]
MPRDRLIVPLFLLVEVLLFFRHVLFVPSRWVIPWDLRYYHYPLAQFFADALRAGELPLWDPFTYCGRPVYAILTMQGFYPPFWLTTAVHLGTGWEMLLLLQAMLVAHIWIAGLGCYRLLRHFDLPTGAALAGAAAWVGGAYFASQPQHLGAICTAAWLPWMAAAGLRRNYPAAAMLGALILLAGFPAAAAAAFATTAGLWLLFAPRRDWLWLAAAGAGAVWLALPQLAPTWELARLSIASQRAAWLGDGGGIPAGSLATLVHPNYWGVFEFDSATWPHSDNPTYLYLYGGLAALIAMLRGLRAAPGRLALLAGLAAVVMLGENTIVWTALYHRLPEALRTPLYPESFLLAFSLLFAMLAAYGVAAWTRDRTVMMLIAALFAADTIGVSSGRPFNTADRLREPGITATAADGYPELITGVRELAAGTRTDVLPGAPLYWSGAAPLFRIPSANGDDPFALSRFIAVRLAFTGGERWGRYYEVQQAESPMLDLLNVGVLISRRNGSRPGLLKAEELPGHTVYLNLNPLPRLFLVGETAPAANLEDALEKLRRIDPRRQAVVEGAPAFRASAPISGTVDLLGASGNTLELEVSTAAPAFLVTSEAFYPGWRATIDGEPADLVLTNAAFRGLPLPEGTHRVRMWFAPDIFRWSAIAGGAGWLLAALAVVVRRRSHTALD